MEEWYLWYMYTYGMHTYNLLTIDTQNRKANLHPHCEAVKEDNFWSKNGQFKYIVCTITYIHYSAAGDTRRRCLESRVWSNGYLWTVTRPWRPSRPL